ncbi:hypothetical protein HDE_01421 [Halotydeus destructor]|nr:hypothetical protein HDE_01421 [Halotydeus destructor]
MIHFTPQSTPPSSPSVGSQGPLANRKPPCFHCVQLTLYILIVTNAILLFLILYLFLIAIKVHKLQASGTRDGQDLNSVMTAMLLTAFTFYLIMLVFGALAVIKGHLRMTIAFASFMTLLTVITIKSSMAIFSATIAALSWWFASLIRQSIKSQPLNTLYNL